MSENSLKHVRSLYALGDERPPLHELTSYCSLLLVNQTSDPRGDVPPGGTEVARLTVPVILGHTSVQS